MAQTSAPGTDLPADVRPWPALGALCIGFFMILVDMTIVTVATPDIMAELDASTNDVLWVTSAYLLAYAVPVLISGRLGDRIGPKWMYLAGLAVFTAASLWCALSGSIEMLIAARVVQGVGAAMITPQTMAVITRIFPPERRGQAMALWGATAGVATLVGPILGGVLVDAGGWEWIFLINVPVGMVAFVLNWRLVPVLATHEHTFDWIGVVLSGVAMFALVFGLQDGEQRGWDALIWALIIGGILAFVIFVWWESRTTKEALVPLHIFRDRNFSVSNVGISAMGLAATAMGFPLMLYAQLVRGYSALEASLLMAPMAIVSLIMAPVVGRFTDKVHPRLLVGTGFALTSIAVFWVAAFLTPTADVWQILLPMGLLGLGMAGVWAPLAATATRNLPMHLAGAGAGVYNATRLVGSVIGSAGIAVLMESRLAAQGLEAGGGPEAGGVQTLPPAVHDAFSTAMSEAMIFPAVVLAIGMLAALLFQMPKHLGAQPAPVAPAAQHY
ncbi:MAG TPA: DHA2 family efflux MFS transporter permease subunit [Nocardioides sp.]|nr:DHA2 family efflux MFS transporter permease subunit [Nocardioides sp.]